MSSLGFKLILLVAVIYVCAVLWMWARQENYLFLPKHYEVLPEFERFRWDRKINGVQHQGWFLDKGKARTVIYHGGNAEDLAGHCEVMMDGLDANALLVNYRGYGQSEGTPGEKEMVADCVAIFDLFCAEKNVAPSNIFLMGRSLGSGVAIQVAAARPEAAGIILVTPYESMETIARFRYPWLPAKGILRHSFRAIDYAPKIQMPALVLLSEFDEVIPVATGRKLGEALGGPKEIITLPMGHMDINEHPGYYGAINHFVNR
ncbi:MAG: alpha/beta hydrolase [Candidatus Methylomirabilota bacterium]